MFNGLPVNAAPFNAPPFGGAILASVSWSARATSDIAGNRVMAAGLAWRATAVTLLSNFVRIRVLGIVWAAYARLVSLEPDLGHRKFGSLFIRGTAVTSFIGSAIRYPTLILAASATTLFVATRTTITGIAMLVGASFGVDPIGYVFGLLSWAARGRFEGGVVQATKVKAGGTTWIGRATTLFTGTMVFNGVVSWLARAVTDIAGKLNRYGTQDDTCSAVLDLSPVMIRGGRATWNARAVASFEPQLNAEIPAPPGRVVIVSYSSRTIEVQPSPRTVYV